MFRLFLRKKLRSSPTKQAAEPARKRRNRRIFERYKIDFKHLTMMNEQDILLIREISAKGFSTHVSPRFWERFKVGDVFSARMRYLGEIYDLEARVSWKAKSDTVGFELLKAEKKTIDFMQRLLYPSEIAGSLRLVDAKFMAENNEKKVWYHGDQDTDLYIWHNHEGDINAWRLITRDKFVEWAPTKGVNTGQIKIVADGINGVLDLPNADPSQVHDQAISLESKQLAIDVMMAVEIPEKEQILATLTQAS